MTPKADRALLALLGSRTRLLTMATLANAGKPLTGYRVAVVAGLPRDKVYPVIRKAVAAGLLERVKGGYRMVDGDVQALLRKRVRIRWDEDWDRERDGWGDQTPARLSAILESLPRESTYLRPKNWVPSKSAKAKIREMRRPASKDVFLRAHGMRTSERKDWPGGR